MTVGTKDITADVTDVTTVTDITALTVSFDQLSIIYTQHNTIVVAFDLWSFLPF